MMNESEQTLSGVLVGDRYGSLQGGYSDNFLGDINWDYDDFSSGGSFQVNSTPAWMQVFNTSASVLSQFLASRGRYQTTQIGAGGTPALGGSPYGANYTPAQPALTLAQQQALAGRNGGLGLDDAAFSITDFVSRNPLLVGGVAVGIYLLVREPPRRR